MTDYKEILNKPEYDFINKNEHLGKHMILLGLETEVFVNAELNQYIQRKRT